MAKKARRRPGRPAKRRPSAKTKKLAQSPKSKKPKELTIIEAKSLVKSADIRDFWEIKAVAQAWDNLSDKLQDFLILWLTNGYNATMAYQRAFGTKSYMAAATGGSMALKNAHIIKIRNELRSYRIVNFERALQVMHDLMEQEDNPSIRFYASKFIMALDEGGVTGSGRGLDDLPEGTVVQNNTQINNYNFPMGKFDEVLNGGSANGMEISDDSKNES